MIMMVWTLISYSDIRVPLEPFEGSYIIGIVENEDSERKMVQIDKILKNTLEIGMRGNLTRIQKSSREINIFQPI